MDDKYIEYIQDAFNEKVNSLFTVTRKESGGWTGSSIAVDNTGSVTQKVILETKFNGTKKDCDSTPTDWTREAKGEYSYSKPYTMATFNDNKTIAASSVKFSYTIPAADPNYGGKYAGITIEKYHDRDYTASKVWPIFYGWSNYANPTAASSNAVSTIKGLSGRSNSSSLNISSYTTPTSGTQYFWLAVHGTGTIDTKVGPAALGTSPEKVDLGGNLGTYNVYYTASYTTGKSGDFIVTASYKASNY